MKKKMYLCGLSITFLLAITFISTGPYQYRDFDYACTVLNTVIQICLGSSKFSSVKYVHKALLCFQRILISLHIQLLKW